jgi:uncharacterized protein (TIGR03437 family)
MSRNLAHRLGRAEAVSRSRLVVTLAALALSIGHAEPATGPVTASAKLNALWVYSITSLPNPVTDAATRDALIQDGFSSGVNMLYLSVYSSTPNSAKRYMYDDSDIADLIGKAHAKGMQVYAAYGDSDWPTLGCAASAFPMQRMAEVIAYNSANRSAMFDGVILDVEPSGTPDFQALLGLYQCFQQQAQANGMGLSAAISAFWNTMVTFNQITEEAYKQIVDLKLNNVVVMGYRNFAGTSDCTQGDGVVCLDGSLIAYANSVSQGNTILVGLDTDNPATSGSTAEETFFSMGQAAMNAVAQSVFNQFAAASQTFGGFSIHNYRDSYLNGQLSGWPATNPALPIPVPQFTAAAVTNDASFIGGSVAPGETIAIFGVNLGPATAQVLQVANEKATTSLGGVQVLFDGNPAPMVLASSGQLAAIVPFDVKTGSTTIIQVVYGGVASAAVVAQTTAAAPAIFTADSSGKGQGAILNQNYSYNNSSNPAAAGSVAMLYLTGAGQMTPAAVDGSLNANPDSLGQTALPVTAQIGGQPADVLYAGSSVGIVSGVIQVNLAVPNGLSAGAQPVTVQIGGVATQAGVTIAVQ